MSLPSAEPCPDCNGSVLPAMVMLCPACDTVADVLTLFAAGTDPRFTDNLLEGIDDVRGTFMATVGPGGFDQAVAAMRDELINRHVRDDELYALITGGALLVKLLEGYEVPPDLDANAFAFGVLAALAGERQR